MSQSKSAAASHPLRPLDYLTLNVYWFALSFLWNSMGPILLPAVVSLSVAESQRGGALGLISALGLIVAIVVQPTAGAWSDNHMTRWGRRRPYLVGGTLFGVIFLLAMAFSGNYVMLVVAYLLLQTSSNIAHGPYQGYIPDLVPEDKRGAMTGVKQLLEIVGIVVTSLVMGYLVEQGQIAMSFLAIIFCLLVCMVITALFVTEQPFDGVLKVEPEKSVPQPHHDSARDMLASLFHSRDFFLWLVSRLLILVGANLVRNYALYFFIDVLGLLNPAGAVGGLLAVIAASIAVVVYPSGALSDRWGQKRLVVLFFPGCWERLGRFC